MCSLRIPNCFLTRLHLKSGCVLETGLLLSAPRITLIGGALSKKKIIGASGALSLRLAVGIKRTHMSMLSCFYGMRKSSIFRYADF